MLDEIDFRHILASLLDTRGRLSRGGFWLAYAAALGFALVTSPFLVLFMSLKWPDVTLLLWSPMMVLVMLAAIRRLHDRGKSGWWLLAANGPALLVIFLVEVIRAVPGEGPLGLVTGVLFAIAMAAGFWLMVQILVMAGTPGSNRFGPDPLQSEGGGALRRATALLARR